MTVAHKKIAILVLCLSFMAVHITEANDGIIPGQAIMKITFAAEPDSVLSGIEATLEDSIPQDRIFLINFPPQVPLEQILEYLQNNPTVIFAEPNFEIGFPESYQMSIAFPDDNPPPLLTGESPASFYDQPALYSIGLDSAHQLSLGNNINVAVIDNGIDFDHPLFTGRVTTLGYDFLDGDADPSEEAGTVLGHGTFVSGLIILTAPDCQVTPLRAFDGDGFSNSFAIAQAIYYAIENDVDIINMSFGMYDQCFLIQQACSTAVESCISLVAACGNDAFSAPTYPSALPGVIAVSAIDDLDLLADFSNYGDYIDICAPGVDVYSSLAGDYEWGTWSGTSFSTPFVSAICALVLSRSEDFTSLTMEAHVRQTAAIHLGWGTINPPDDFYGFGKIDAAKAVWSVDAMSGGICGDVNDDGVINVGDVVFLIALVFKNGPAPEPYSRGDINCDIAVDVADPVYLISYIFKSGQAPCCQ